MAENVKNITRIFLRRRMTQRENLASFQIEKKSRQLIKEEK